MNKKSRCDFDYVIRLFEKNSHLSRNLADNGLEQNGEHSISNESGQSTSSKKKLIKTYNYVTIKRVHDPLVLRQARKLIYDPDPIFRFTSRYCNTITVGLVALYYVFLYWTYSVCMNMSQLVSLLPEFVDTGKIEINLGDILCRYVPDACLPALQEAGIFKIPLPQKIIKFFPGLRSSILAVFIVPLFVAVILCIGQVFLLVRETKTHLLEMYQGKCEFVRNAKNLSKASIASSSFHFGG